MDNCNTIWIVVILLDIWIFHCGNYSYFTTHNSPEIHIFLYIKFAVTIKITKTVQCSKCNTKHLRPVGRKCTRTPIPVTVPVELNTTPVSQSSPTSIATNDVVLQRITELAGAIVTMQQQIVSLQQASTSNPSVWDTLRLNRDSHTPPHNGASPPLHPRPPLVNLHQLRDDSTQAKVHQRLQELETATAQAVTSEQGSYTKIKSGRDRVAGSENTRKYVPWPQEFIFVGPTRARVAYDSLNQAQFTAGMLEIVNAESHPQIKSNMITYLAQIHKDIADFSYSTMLAINAVVLTAVEEGRADWTDLDGINTMRKQYLMNSLSSTASVSHNRSSNSNTKGSFSGSSSSNSSNNFTSGGNSNSNVNSRRNKMNRHRLPCSKFNLGVCNLQSDHTDGDKPVSHICAYCFIHGFQFPHSESSCRRKTRSPPRS